MQKRFSLKAIDFTILVLACYGLTFGLNQLIHLNLEWIPGSLLVLFLPGRLILAIWPRLGFPREKYSNLALAAFLSFSAISFLQLVFLHAIQLIASAQIALVIGLTSILWILACLLHKPYRVEDWITEVRALFPSWRDPDVQILATVALCLLATFMINPLAQNADGYLITIKESIAQHVNILPARQLFVSTVVMLHFLLALDYRFVYRTVYLMLFYVSTFFLFGYAKHKLHSRILIALSYLSLLASPVILTEVNIIRPQTAVIAFTLPVLILSLRSVEEHKVEWGVIALGMSFVGLGFHELGVVLGLMAFVSLLYNLVYFTLVAKVIRLRHYIWAGIILLPYIKLFSLPHYLNSTYILAKVAFHSFTGFHWRWWFINSYVTADGMNLGWPGIQAVYYYLYNGILFFSVTFLLVFWAFRQRRWPLSAFIPFVYFLIYFTFAEILPRFGFYFFPNRAWVHLMLPLSLLLIFSFGIYEQFRSTPPRSVILVFALTYGLGAFGTVYVATQNVSLIFHDELKAMRYIQQKTPPNSLFFSTQDNRSLISVYGERPYSQLVVTKKLDKQAFDALVASGLSEASKDHTKILVPEMREDIALYTNNQLVSRTSKVIQAMQEQYIPALYRPGVPVYFIYSYRKLAGINGQRGYYEQALDRINRDIYKQLGYKYVYADSHILILKIR